MTPDNFLLLLDLVGPRLPLVSEIGRRSLSHEQYLAITLRFLSSGESQTSIGIQFKVARPTVHKVLTCTLSAIYDALRPIVLSPPTTEKWRQLATEFESTWQLPFCAGAVDGKHVTMDCPNNTGSLYYNYKVMVNY